MYPAFYIPGIFLALVVLYLLSCIRVLFEYDRGVVFRLGRALPQPKGAGLILVFWPIDWMVRVSLRTHVEDVTAQDVIRCSRGKVTCIIVQGEPCGQGGITGRRPIIH